jgi:hypothetical protein
MSDKPPAPKMEVHKIGVGAPAGPAGANPIAATKQPPAKAAEVPAASMTKAKQAAVPSKNDHPDAAYLKGEDIGVVIAKGMAVMYKSKPKNPVDLLAKWLLNYANVKNQAAAVAAEAEKVSEQKTRHE